MKPKELTLRGLILGALITTIFTAANIYLGLKVGLTFASSINPERADRLGTLVASGLIVGESLWGVINAGLIVGLSNDAPIGFIPADFVLAPWLGVVGFVGAIVLLYGWMLRRSAAVPTVAE
jgi:hypothetical protein